MSLLGWACRPRPTVIGHHVINTCVHTWRDLHWGPELATSQLVAPSGVLDRPWQGFTQDDEMLALLQESILHTGQEDHEPQPVVEVTENLDFSSYIHRGQQQGGKGRLPVLQNSPWGVAPLQGFLMEAMGGMNRRSHTPHRTAPVCLFFPSQFLGSIAGTCRTVSVQSCFAHWERPPFLHLNMLQLPKLGSMETRGKGTSVTMKSSYGQSPLQKGW